MNALATSLIEHLNQRTATIAIVGMGYVGLPLAKAMHEAGFQVIGFDIDPQMVR